MKITFFYRKSDVSVEFFHWSGTTAPTLSLIRFTYFSPRRACSFYIFLKKHEIYPRRIGYWHQVLTDDEDCLSKLQKMDPDNLKFGIGTDWPTQAEVDSEREQEMEDFARMSSANRRATDERLL